MPAREKENIPEEILKARVNKNYFYPAVFHADAYSVRDSIAVGFIDEVVTKDQFMERVLAKANELASLPHPFYANTKASAQNDTRQKIADAIKKYEKLQIPIHCVHRFK